MAPLKIKYGGFGDKTPRIEVKCAGCGKKYRVTAVEYRKKMKKKNKEFFHNRDCYLLWLARNKKKTETKPVETAPQKPAPTKASWSRRKPGTSEKNLYIAQKRGGNGRFLRIPPLAKIPKSRMYICTAKEDGVLIYTPVVEIEEKK